MAAPKGNANAAKAKIWSDAIRRALHSKDERTKRLKLDELAERLIAKGLEGDVSALREIGDRVEGKAAQPIEGSIDATLTVEILRFADSLTR